MRQLKITKQVTNRETASLDKYLQEIGKVDLITADQEVELAQRIREGDQEDVRLRSQGRLRLGSRVEQVRGGRLESSQCRLG